MRTISRKKQQRRDAIFLTLVGLPLILVVYFLGGGILRLLVLLAVGAGIAAYVTCKVVMITTSSKGRTFAYIWNELLYSLVCVPILVAAVLYLPVSLYFLFASGERMTAAIRVSLIVIVLVAVVVSLIIFIVNFIKDVRINKEIEKENSVPYSSP